MIETHKLLLAVAACAIPVAAFAAAANNGIVVAPFPSPATPPNLVAPNATPGGITLVPGTVVTPAVGGTMVTGTVPLAGTVGSTGVGTFDPGLGMNPLSGTRGTLYPQALTPQIGLPATNQSTLPQTVPGVSGLDATGLQNMIPYGTAPSVSSCPGGVTSANGIC